VVEGANAERTHLRAARQRGIALVVPSVIPFFKEAGAKEKSDALARFVFSYRWDNGLGQQVEIVAPVEQTGEFPENDVIPF
jgi:hypothetical protein